MAVTKQYRERWQINTLKNIKQKIDTLLWHDVDQNEAIPEIIKNNLAELHSNLKDYLK